jgi:H+/gluconate symporter-like permease
MELRVAMWVCIIWILLMMILMYYLLRKYTFGDWDEKNPNPYKNETMGLPRGLFRGILTLSVLFIVMVLQISTLYVKPMDLSMLKGLFSTSEFASNTTLDSILSKLLVPEERFAHLMTAFQMIIAFYFGGKVFHHVTQAERDVAKTRTEKSEQAETARAKIAAGQVFEDNEAIG